MAYDYYAKHDIQNTPRSTVENKVSPRDAIGGSIEYDDEASLAVSEAEDIVRKPTEKAETPDDFFDKKTLIVWNKLPKLEVSGAAVDVVTKAGGIAKDIVKETREGIADLFVQVTGIDTKVKPEKPNLTPEQAKEAEDAAKARRDIQTVQEAIDHNDQQEAINSNKESVRIIGRVVTQEEVNKKRKVSSSFNGGKPSESLSHRELVEFRIAEIEELKAAEEAKKQQDMAEVNKKAGPNLDLNKVAEGGNVLSTTGGGAG